MLGRLQCQRIRLGPLSGCTEAWARPGSGGGGGRRRGGQEGRREPDSRSCAVHRWAVSWAEPHPRGQAHPDPTPPSPPPLGTSFLSRPFRGPSQLKQSTPIPGSVPFFQGICLGRCQKLCRLILPRLVAHISPSLFQSHRKMMPGKS